MTAPPFSPPPPLLAEPSHYKPPGHRCNCHPNKYEVSSLWLFVGPTSETLAQHCLGVAESAVIFAFVTSQSLVYQSLTEAESITVSPTTPNDPGSVSGGWLTSLAPEWSILRIWSIGFWLSRPRCTRVIHYPCRTVIRCLWYPRKHETFTQCRAMLAQRRRRWANIVPILGERRVVAGMDATAITYKTSTQCSFHVGSMSQMVDHR